MLLKSLSFLLFPTLTSGENLGPFSSTPSVFKSIHSECLGSVRSFMWEYTKAQVWETDWDQGDIWLTWLSRGLHLKKMQSRWLNSRCFRSILETVCGCTKAGDLQRPNSRNRWRRTGWNPMEKQQKEKKKKKKKAPVPSGTTPPPRRQQLCNFISGSKQLAALKTAAQLLSPFSDVQYKLICQNIQESSLH